jgi:hypothetical protein
MGMSGSEPEGAPVMEEEPVAVPEPGGDVQPLPVFTGLVALGAEDAPACSDGICF